MGIDPSRSIGRVRESCKATAMPKLLEFPFCSSLQRDLSHNSFDALLPNVAHHIGTESIAQKLQGLPVTSLQFLHIPPERSNLLGKEN